MRTQGRYEGDALIKLTADDIDLIVEELMKGYLEGRMDNITYYALHSKLFQGYFQIAREQASRDVKSEGRRRK
jgi:hypothetical protein